MITQHEQGEKPQRKKIKKLEDGKKDKERSFDKIWDPITRFKPLSYSRGYLPAILCNQKHHKRQLCEELEKKNPHSFH